MDLGCVSKKDPVRFLNSREWGMREREIKYIVKFWPKLLVEWSWGSLKEEQIGKEAKARIWVSMCYV